MPYSLSGCSPSAPGARRPSSSAGRGRVSISPSRGTAAAGRAGRLPRLPSPTSSSRTTALGGRPARQFGEGWLLAVAWKVSPTSSSPGEQDPPSATAADNPQRSRPAPGRCRKEFAGTSAWSGPGPLPVYIVVSSSFQLPPGRGRVHLIPVNSHLPGWETNVPGKLFLGNKCPWAGRGSHRSPSPAGSLVPCEQLPGLKFFFLLLKSL